MVGLGYNKDMSRNDSGLREMLKKIALDMNTSGVPVPLIRDKGKGSLSATMMWISFTLMGACTLLGLFVAIDRLTGLFLAPELAINTIKEAFSMAFQMTGLAMSLYGVRKWQKKGEQNQDIKQEDFAPSFSRKKTFVKESRVKPDNPDSN